MAEVALVARPEQVAQKTEQADAAPPSPEPASAEAARTTAQDLREALATNTAGDALIALAGDANRAGEATSKLAEEQAQNVEQKKAKDPESLRVGARAALEAKQLDSSRSKHLISLDGDEVTTYADYLQSLRDPKVVGKEQYGKGVVNDCHHRGETTLQAETAQDHAMNKYRAKIEAGLVDPAMIVTEMNQKLGVAAEVTDPPTSFEHVVPKVAQELQGFVEKGLLTSDEAAVLQKESEVFSQLYKEGYPDADSAKVYEVTRDMSRMVAYQTRMDKNVLVGSDHGERHILRGNMKFADQIIASLEAQRIPVFAKDKVLVHATIVMHDIGYTNGAAQSPEGFEASKDHPVAGAIFIEANKGWVSEMFGADAVDIIQKGILDHSYVGGAFESPRQEGSHINPDLIRAITSSVDSLGVTAETKVPAFFNNTATVSELFKIRLAGRMTGRDSAGEFSSEEQKIRHDAIVAVRKEKLRELAVAAPTAEQQQAFMSAVESVNVRTSDILGQYTGEVKQVQIVRSEANGQLIPEVQMNMVDEFGTKIRDMFGGKDELQQFVKAMEDLGMTQEQMGQFYTEVASVRESSEQMRLESFSYTSDKAVVRISAQEEASQEFAHMREAFAEAAGVTQEWKIMQKIEGVDPTAENFKDQMTTVVGGLGLLTSKESIKNLLQDGTISHQLDSNDAVIRKDAIARIQATLQKDIDAYLLE